MPEESKTKLAEDRTDLAEDRTILANERTFAGWMRTGFAAVGVGLGFQALFNKMEPDWVPKGIATAFLIIAMIVFWTAERRACAVMGRLKTHEVETVRARNLRLISYAIMACIASLIAAMWLLRIKSEGGS